MAQKPSIPKGTRDFGQEEMAARNYIFDTIRSVYRTYGYVQIETPAMENLSTLLGKYGDEGDKLLFRILNSGEAFKDIDPKNYSGEDGGLDSGKVASAVCDKGLRYDLTVPFARYVVQHQNEIAFPFRRFQIQPVWRADRPQKGRYREFYQCDADVIGSKSQINELELVQIIDTVFTKFGIRVSIRINNRKVLTGLAEICGYPDKVTDITVAIDKLEKIGLEAVETEMREKGLDEKAVAVIEPVLEFEYGEVNVSSKVSANGVLKASVKVKNIGSRDGKEIVQLYIGEENPLLERPTKELKAFEKVSLAPGETKTVKFEIPVSDLAYFNADTHSWVLDSGHKFTAYFAAASDDVRGTADFIVR